MKSLILSLLLILTLSQTPVPIPGLSLDDFDGAWYITWSYNSANDNSQPNYITCLTVNVTTQSDGGSINETTTILGQEVSNILTFVQGSSPANWIMAGPQGQIDWVAFDPLAGAWAVAGNVGLQQAFIVSRTPSLPSVILNAQILLLRGEGYAINSTNTLTYLNNQC